MSQGAGWGGWLRGFHLYLWLHSALKGDNSAELAACFELVKIILHNPGLGVVFFFFFFSFGFPCQSGKFMLL